jgi:hypothetical protein
MKFEATSEVEIVIKHVLESTDPWEMLGLNANSPWDYKAELRMSN